MVSLRVCSLEKKTPSHHTSSSGAPHQTPKSSLIEKTGGISTIQHNAINRPSVIARPILVEPNQIFLYFVEQQSICCVQCSLSQLYFDLCDDDLLCNNFKIFYKKINLFILIFNKLYLFSCNQFLDYLLRKLVYSNKSKDKIGGGLNEVQQSMENDKLVS